jgi:glycosyltransferase involved in cell wall biosynthesis
MKKPMDKNLFKADLHVHSCHSRRPSSWVLKKIGCGESYTEPIDLHRTLKKQGMDVVTITDHNTINGCLEIAHLEDTFISEEVTTYFPQDNCKLHVLVYNITEGQHEEIVRVRKNVFDLVGYLRGEHIVHAVAHPMYSVNGMLRVDHFEQLLLLFNLLELNGARDTLQNTIITRIASALTGETIEELAHRHGITPWGDRPWKKCLISGSDDHSSIYMGTSYTEVWGASCIGTFLEGISRCAARVRTHHSTPKTLAYNIYSVMYQFYDQTFEIDRWIKDSAVSDFFKEMLLSPHDSKGMDSTEPPVRSKRKPAFGFASPTLSKRFLKNLKRVMSLDRFSKKNRSRDFVDSPLSDRFLKNARQVVSCRDGGERGGNAGLGRKPSNAAEGEETWFEFVNTVSNMVMRQLADDILRKLTDADLFYLFSHIGASGSLYMMLSPYFIAYSIFARDRARSIECLERFGHRGEELGLPSRRVAVFTDTFNQINGVATAIQAQMEAARMADKPLKLITCEPGRRTESNVAVFEPVGAYDLPEYPELKIYYPPFLRILSHCYQERFTHIHAETPGAMGLAALGIAKLLNLPFCGTYHTSLPQTVLALTGDPQVEEFFWKYIVWFYGQMETIYVPSAVTGRELAEKGLPGKRIVVHQSGVNTTYFNPNKQNGFFSSRYRIPDSATKLLYVGRVSKEKNLQVLEKMIKAIRRIRNDVHLVIVGEGPYLGAMEKRLDGLPVLFTGYLTGESLAEAYASSDVFVFPSTVDTMGIAVLEAQASGLPVIVTDRGGPRENMVHNETGFVVSADQEQTVDSFVKAALQLCEDPHRMADMGKKARIYARHRSFENSFSTFWDDYGRTVRNLESIG